MGLATCTSKIVGTQRVKRGSRKLHLISANRWYDATREKEWHQEYPICLTYRVGASVPFQSRNNFVWPIKASSKFFRNCVYPPRRTGLHCPEGNSSSTTTSEKRSPSGFRKTLHLHALIKMSNSCKHRKET